MTTTYLDCCHKVTADIAKAKDIITELRREENDPRLGNPRPIVLLNDLRHIYQVGSEGLQRLRQLSIEVGGDFAVIQTAATALQRINTIIPHFATKFEGSG